MSKNTHIVDRKFQCEDPAAPGLYQKGMRFDGTLLNQKYLEGLEKVGFVRKIGTAIPAATDAKEGGGDVGNAESIGALDAAQDQGSDLDLDDDSTPDPGKQEDEGPDGTLQKQEVISDTPITDAINDAPDKEALKAIADKNGSEVRRNLGLDNMRREMLAEFEGK